MEKFSLYELLSFIAPGVAAIFLFNSYSQYVLGWHFVDFGALNFYESIQYLLLALFIGILIHVFVFHLIDKKKKWSKPYKSIIHEPIPSIVKRQDELIEIMPTLKKLYCEETKKPVPEISEDGLFDVGYYYLETNDKISTPKSFQSLYFWMRNTMTLIAVAFILSLFIFILGCFKVFPHFNTCNAFLFIITLPILFIILRIPARWLRMKMVVRIFRSYHSEYIHKKQTN